MVYKIVVSRGVEFDVTQYGADGIYIVRFDGEDYYQIMIKDQDMVWSGSQYASQSEIPEWLKKLYDKATKSEVPKAEVPKSGVSEDLFLKTVALLSSSSMKLTNK